MVSDLWVLHHKMPCLIGGFIICMTCGVLSRCLYRLLFVSRLHVASRIVLLSRDVPESTRCHYHFWFSGFYVRTHAKKVVGVGCESRQHHDVHTAGHIRLSS
ncbi:hypothetical protein BJV78DRAFT_1175546 [Lactifluus subvellereus]|nr:hypothetical protein BJV78DRAFT_1175546 [Lactifluus subvellereus]